MRLWLAAPDWSFRLLGLLFFGAFLGVGAHKYQPDQFWLYVPYCTFPNGYTLSMPWVPVLVDLTFLIMLISFLVRLRPLTRAANGWIVTYTLFTAFLPLVVVYWLGPLLGWIDRGWQFAYADFLWRNPLTWYDAFCGGSLISLGIAMETWGYFVLCKSFSIVPEARQLKTTGPYRFVRHPVYFGQFLAQAGVWLCFATLHVVWVGMYVLFVGLQLYRSKLEEDVLATAFGEEYQRWKEKTFWFV